MVASVTGYANFPVQSVGGGPIAEHGVGKSKECLDGLARGSIPLGNCASRYGETDDAVRVSGLGIFNVAARPAREGRNPQTGETIQIAASKAVRFHAGKAV